MNAPADIRVCFVGDSLTAGFGDPEHLGWAGRVSASAAKNGFGLTTYNLGIRLETSADIAGRWLEECARRLPRACQPHVVFSFGVNDTTEEAGKTRVAAQDSVSNLNAILGSAKTRYKVLMIGPAPVADTDQNRRIDALSRQFDATCRKLEVPYLPVFEALHASVVWMKQAGENDGAHPRAKGYAEFARLVIGWNHWWFRSAAA
ncbi:MAG: GDSL-type esterase/lipase family protein [Stenotrophobium sp.]